MSNDYPAPADFPDLTTFDAVLFDLDGVLTPTSDLHKLAWSTVFSQYFAERGVPAYHDQDYFDYLDGRPRTEGIIGLLASRGIALPTDRRDPQWNGEQGDNASFDDTATGLGLRKNIDFLALLNQGIEAYPGSVELLDSLAVAGTQVAVVSSSKNARQVLAAAGLLDRFTVIVDGNRSAAEGLAGKPAPDTYSYGASLLGVEDARAVVVEDAISGVAAGAAGDFGLVVGVDRGAGAEALRDAGADVVVSDLREIKAGELRTGVRSEGTINE